MLRLLLLSFSLLVLLQQARPQTGTDTLHHRKVYVISGMGWGFSVGETADVLSAKFSNNLGLDISLPNRHYFLYPSVDFLTFEYNQREHDPAYTHTLERGRSNFYILNLAAGIRKQFGNANTYAFVGPGIGIVSEPRAEVQSGQTSVKINNVAYMTPTLRSGVGVDYKVGGFFLFLETGWLHTFRPMQDRQVNVISLFGGLKTDVTALKDNVARVIGVK